MLIFAYDGSLNGDWVAHYAAPSGLTRKLHEILETSQARASTARSD